MLAGNPRAEAKKNVDVDHRAVVPLFALIAALVLVLYALQRRDMRALRALAQQLQRVASGGRLTARLEIDSDKPEMTAFATAINHLLTRTAVADSEAVEAPRLFADLGDRIHEAVLVHREVILYANRQFASFVGVDRVELIGRRLADLVPPEYAELVSENIQRRLAGEPAAERYEVDMVGLQGQMSRLEIASTVVELRKAQRAAHHRRRDHSDADGARAARAAGRRRAVMASHSCWRSTRWPRRSSPPTATAAST